MGAGAVTDAPDRIDLARDRDLVGRRWEIWLRRGLFALLPVVAVLALLNVFGQHPQSHAVNAEAASLELRTPARVRGGLLYESRFRISAHHDLAAAALVLAPGWLEGMTVNTIEPSPESETSVDGRLRLELGPISAGNTFVLFLQTQVNPTTVGRHLQTVQLYDGAREILELPRSISIFP
jgi:hypothetical protein